MMENKKILLLATTSYAGMGPYIASIVNSFEPKDNICFFLLESSDKYYSRNIRKDLLHLGKIVQTRPQSKLETLLDLIIVKKNPFAKDIKRFCQINNVDIVHALSSLTDVNLARYLALHYKLLCTVHDLYPHEAKKAFYKQWRQAEMYKRIFKTFKVTKYLYTNSLKQKKEQEEIYPEHRHFYSPFPTLVTDEIARGNIVPDELKKVERYILFFGRIEAYKGVEILLSAYDDLQKNGQLDKIKLVIAGKGELNSMVNNPGIVRVNRYIDDREIKYMYEHANFVVYPYISATQSGVLSVASYFKKPMVLSDVDFFKDTLGENKAAIFFEKNNVNSLKTALMKMMESRDRSIMEAQSSLLYNKQYSNSACRKQLIEIYKSLEINNLANV